MKLIISFCLCAAILVGCASNLPPEERSDVERLYLSYTSDPIDRFRMVGGIRGWEAVSNNYLVLRTDRGKTYLVRTWHCPSLRNAWTIGVLSTISNTVSDTDKIVIGRDTCQIREIRQIDLLRLEADREARKTKD